MTPTQKTYAVERMVKYLALTVFLGIGFFALRGSSWTGSEQLHTIFEVICSLLALVIGVFSLVRYYSKKERIFLLVGVGFLGTASLDAYHAVVTSSFFDQFVHSPDPSLVPWSWNASRLYLAVFLFLSWLDWWFESYRKKKIDLSESAIYFTSIVVMLLSFFFFVFATLPRAHYPEYIFTRPQELVAASLFLMSLAAYFLKGRWKANHFEHWLMYSLIVSFLLQWLFISSSARIYDVMFDLGHVLKALSYSLVLTGLITSMYHLFREAEESRIQVSTQNETLLKVNKEAEHAKEKMEKSAKKLSKMNDMMVGRELEMKKLKEQINKLTRNGKKK
jgi:disulfide bond formation protein DsbB